MDAELSLEKATELVKENKAIKLQQTTIHSDNTADVGAVNRKPSRRHVQKNKHPQKSLRTHSSQSSVTCSRCGQAAHSRMQCPARDQDGTLSKTL